MQAILTVYKKELRDMFRDKRVRRTTLLMPSVTIFIFVFLFGFIDSAVSTPSNVKIHYVTGCQPDVIDYLKSSQVTLIEVPSVDKGEELIKSGDARLVLEVLPNPAAPGTFLANAYFNPKQELSMTALQTLERTLPKLNEKSLDVVLKAKGIPASAGKRYQMSPQEVQVGGKSAANSMTVALLPYLIIIWAFMGGINIATELVAGEKDKNTLETLLISPATRTQIAMGKYLSLATICMICSCSSFIALFISQHFELGGKMFGASIGLNPVSVLLMLVVLVPTVAFFASLLLAISSYAKNPREAQGYLSGISMLVTLPALFSQFIGYTDLGSKTWIYTIPVLNAAVNLRQILLVQFNPLGYAITLVISLALAAIGIRAAVSLFNRESVLARV